jgi:hypothetical protein
MNSALPLREDLPVMVDPATGQPIAAKWTERWKAYFNAIARALVWNLSLTGTKTFDFGNIAAHTEASHDGLGDGARTTDTPT